MRTRKDILGSKLVSAMHQEYDGWGSNEREQDAPSWWVALNPDFNHNGCSSIHAKTIKEVIELLKEVNEGPPF